MKEASPAILVIIGISGDLAERYLLPALYHLEQDGLLHENFKIIGTSRREMSKEPVEQKLKTFISECGDRCDESALVRFMDRISLVSLDPASAGEYELLANELQAAEESAGACLKRLFYMAIPPGVLPPVIDAIANANILPCAHGDDGRLLLEKPFGRDFDSAQALSNQLQKYFKEDQLYRIDHFLAKETAQNIMYFRSHNPIVRDIWSSKFIDHIQITVAEDIDIQDRVDFYEQTGALRDVVQNHMLQLLALTLMEEPKSITAEEVRSARADILKKLTPANPAEAVRAQYEGYRQEVGNQQSAVETYTALTVRLEGPRWQEVPVYLRHGKALEQKLTDITLVFTETEGSDKTNLLSIRIQPNEGIALKLVAKKPGLKNEAEEVIMDYCYDQDFDGIRHDAYEKLLIDAINGEQMLFPSTDEIMASWNYVQPLLDAWSGNQEGLETYAKGSWGPQSADAVIKTEGTGWIAHKHNVCIPKII